MGPGLGKSNLLSGFLSLGDSVPGKMTNVQPKRVVFAEVMVGGGEQVARQGPRELFRMLARLGA